MSNKEFPSVWEDPNVQLAFRDGRSADDISVLNCRDCGELSYYVCTEDEEPPEDRPYIILDCPLTMADVADAECADY
jgi:hypothetical protein